MKKIPSLSASHSRGSALLIVLAFLLLLTTLTVAFLSRATFERQLSNASFSQGKVGLAGQGAIATIIGDLQQEIIAGSNVGAGTTIPVVASGYYYPNAPATAIPATSGFTSAAGLENLVAISGAAPFFSGANYSSTGPNRASSISTYKNPSLNGRLITPARWNAPLLLAPNSSSDYTPSSSNFVAPNWIYIARDGSNPGNGGSSNLDASYIFSANVAPTATPTTGTLGTNAVTQRYAYAIYDEGSTLDLNEAGSPVASTSGTTVVYGSLEPYKNALAYADLTQLPTVSGLGATQQQAFINAIVGWRNYATAAVSTSSNFPNYSAIQGDAFDKYLMFNSTGFLGVTSPNVNTTNGFGPRPGPGTNGYANQTDNAFASRQQLLQFFLLNLGQNSTFLTNSGLSLNNLASLLPYFGTFSRDLSQPSYAPDPARPVVLAASSGGNDLGGASSQDTVNPSFLNVTVSSTFTRNDGTAAVVGEPLVKKRFALNRLAWLTYKGPSALRTPIAGNTAPSSSTSGGDYDLYELENSNTNTYGIPQSFLAQGTAANIQAYFGLVWVQDTSTSVGIGDGTYKWKYEHGTKNSGLTTSGAPGAIMTLAQVQAAGRDPDFFELLKAAVTVGAIAKPATTSGPYTGASATPSGYSNRKDSSVDAYIIQLGANIIAQSNPANYCPRIIFDDGVTFPGIPQEYRGIEDLPYLYRTQTQYIKTNESSPAETNDGQTQVGLTTAVSGTYVVPQTDPLGQGYMLEVPVIWNPHAWNPNLSGTLATGISPLGNGSAASPEFRISMLSTDPTEHTNGGTINLGVTQLAFFTRYSPTNSQAYKDALPTPTSTFTFTGANVPTISFSVQSATTTGTLSLFREPTLLDKPDPGKSGVPGPPYGTGLTSSIQGYAPGAVTSGYIKSLYQSAAYSSGTDNQKYLGFSLAAPGGPTLNSLWISITGTSMPTDTGTIPGIAYSNGYYQISGLGDYDGTGGVGSGHLSGNFNFTYRMQYVDPIDNTKMDTYDEKFLPLPIPIAGEGGSTNPFLGTLTSTGATIANPTTPWSGASICDPSGSECYTTVADPRTNRWSNQTMTPCTRSTTSCLYSPPPITSKSASKTYGSAWGAWVDQSVNTVLTGAPDYSAGYAAVCPYVTSTGTTSPLGFYGLQVAAWPGITGPFLTGAVFAQNVTGAYSSNVRYVGDTSMTGAYTYKQTSQYYADADGVVRRGTAGYLSPSSTPSEPYGLPLATSSSTIASNNGNPIAANNGNRPVILHRPFRTVAELGYTFSGTPGKNIDFSTPESGYSALLDVFCINDTNDPGGLVAGKVDINTRQGIVLQAILSKAYKDELSSYFTTSTTVSSNEASALINDPTHGLLHRTVSTAADQGPLRNISDLVGKFVPTNYTATNEVQTSPAAYNGSAIYSGFSADMNSVTSPTMASSAPPMNVVQRFHEAAIRALAANTTSRVWNLMIDVIAQNGRFPGSAKTLADFAVEGERRYWVHVAIDRYTGKVLDEQVEEVKE